MIIVNPRWYETWPPVASDVCNESDKELVPPLLFNFFAWLLGFSDELVTTDYLQVQEKEATQIFSILSRFDLCF